MSTAEAWVTRFLDRTTRGLDIDRLVETSPGLDAAGILQVLGDERLGADVIQAMSDLMHPTDSMYFDAIFGAFHGQVAIRSWLLPTMSDISFIEFVPTAETELFETGSGTSSVDEWQMWANLDGERLPLPRGVSTRRYRDGWVTWNADVYDTGPMRRPPSDPTAEPAPLPDPPQTPWESEPMVGPTPSEALRTWLDRPASERGPLAHEDIHTVMVTPELGMDPGIVGSLFHPSESVLVEPAGDVVGADAIQSYLAARRARSAAPPIELIGPPLFNGDCTAFEWVARPANGAAVRGTSVCRYGDGTVVYAADYYDTATR